MALTLEQFRASGTDCADLGAFLQDDILEGTAGRIYDGSLYIERWEDGRSGIAPPNGPTWLLTIFRDQWADDDLAALEARLWRDFYLPECTDDITMEAMAIAERWVDAIGLGFHPDTGGTNYEPPLSSPAEYDADMARLFDISADPYAVCLDAMRYRGLID